MTSKADYSPEQWRLLAGVPVAIGLSVILAEDQGGRRATRKELAALEAAPGKVAAEFADNALVQALLADVKANAAARQVEKHSREKGQTEQRIYEETYRMCQQVAAVLHVKSNYEEARGYKRFAAEVGAEVARAAADAEYLGIGGGTLSSNERKLLRALGEAMGLDLDE
jgi:hypothetical protein